MGRRKPSTFPVKRWNQGELMYPAKQFVCLTKDEKATIGFAMLRLWTAVDLLNEATDQPHQAVDHEVVQAAVRNIQVEAAVLNAAVAAARRGGHYRGTLNPLGPDIPDEEPPF